MSVYGALLARPGARALACACALGWLSFGGLVLVIVLAAERATGSFPTAGATAAAFTAASASLAPLRGRLVDRRGGPALLALALLHALALTAFAAAAGVVVMPGAPADGGMPAAGAGGGGAVLAAGGDAGVAGVGVLAAGGDAGVAGAPTAALIVFAALAGACAPPLVAAARALWPRVAGPSLVRTAHALNALLGDLGGVAGPALAALLTTVAAPAVAPALLALGPLAGALLLARAASALPRPAPSPTDPAVGGDGGDLCHPGVAERHLDDRGPGEGGPCGAGGRRGVLRGNRGMQVLLAGDLLAGTLLGAAELLAPARAEAAGTPQLAALPLALLAAGSAAGALWSGRSRRAGAPAARALGGLALLATALPAGLLASLLSPTTASPHAAGLLATPLGASGNPLAPLCLAFPLAGVGYGLFTVALLELLDRLVPARNAVEALTWLTTAQGAGLALGTLLGGLAAG
ncbi:hypothetical protein [Conexibacter arvalis]|uniref:MFS transporter n=1 Tax=Conexibacter arvalis TaxID=912552 RepID=A0A840I929_9ACTN|nr:hypothetical protein [Conexibacter arvalis]MBB4660771.1 hypothetical protein [Conexibacter arvalis]